MIRPNLLSVLLTISSLYEVCLPTGKFSIQLVHYQNPGKKSYNGECCDNHGWCLNSCDNYFKFCLTPLGSTVQCLLGNTETAILGHDNFRLRVGSGLGGGLINPLTYTFNEWTGGVNIGVEVWDDDDGKLIGELDDLVDKYSLNFKGPAEPDKDSAHQHHYVLRGQHSSFSIIVQVYCDSMYMIPRCETPCVARDDELGHFMCNYTAGQKVCMEGWWDIAANCTKKKMFCERQNDTVMGHYECNPVSGAKICHDGWTGKNCTEENIKLSIRPSATPLTTNLTTQLINLATQSITMVILRTTLNWNSTLQPSMLTTHHAAMITAKPPSGLPTIIKNYASSQKHSILSISIAPSGPRSSAAVFIKIESNKTWTKAEQESLKNFIAGKLNKFCASTPHLCGIESNLSDWKNTTLFNTSSIHTEVKIQTNSTVILKMKVPLPVLVSKVPGVTVPVTVIKTVVERNQGELKKLLDSNIVYVAIDDGPTVLSTSHFIHSVSASTPTAPTEYEPEGIIPTSRLNPLLFLVGAIGLVVILLITMLAVKLRCKRSQTKVRPVLISPYGKKRAREFTQPLKNIGETNNLRIRSWSMDSQKHVKTNDSPFVPDF